MYEPQFHETRMGRKFYEAQLPALISALERIADVLEGVQERWKTNDAQSAKPSGTSSSSSPTRTPGSQG